MLETYKKLTLSLVNLVNAPRGQHYEQYRNKVLLKDGQTRQLINAGQALMAERLAYDGLAEISMRLSASQLVITIKDSRVSQLSPDDVVVCAVTAGKTTDLAPRHLAQHRRIYENTAAEAIIVAYPAYTMTLTNAQQHPNPAVAPDIYDRIGGIGGPLDDNHAMLIPGVGALAWDVTPLGAVERMAALEYVSYLTVLSNQAGLPPRYEEV